MFSLRLLAFVLAVSCPCAAAAAEPPRPQAIPPVAPLSVVHGFDPPATVWSSGHRGVDLAGQLGQVVRSPLPGVVRFVGVIAGKPTVSIDHGDAITTYEPVVGWVQPGQQVARGDALGTLQTVTGHCFPATCLHWGLKVDGEYADPLSLLGSPRVRLLPTSPTAQWGTFTREGGLVGRPFEVAPW